MLELITGILGTILYPLFSIVFIFIDTLQLIFKGFAGVGNVKYGSGFTNWNVENISSENTGDLRQTGIVYYLLQSDLVYNMVWSIAILAIFLLIIFTAMAVFKNMYTSQPKKWDQIIGKALLGLANFVIVPVVCLFGVWLGNIVLNAVDGATSSGGSVALSRKLFVASAYNANHYRDDKLNPEAKDSNPNKAEEVYRKTYNTTISLSGKSNAELAQIIDDCYARSDGPDIHWYWNVDDGYNIAKINYITMLVGGIFMSWVLVSLAYAMVRRIFIILMLYIVSPVMCAMYPWDDGNALKSWRSTFVKSVISVFGAVAGMNLFFSVLPLVEKVRISDGSNPFIDSIVHLLIIVCGMFAMKDFIGTLSNLIGADDALSQGANMRKSVKDAVGKRVKTAAIAGVGAFAVGRAASKSSGSKGRGFWEASKSLGRQASNSMLGAAGIDVEKYKKEYSERYKEGYDSTGKRLKQRKELGDWAEDYKKGGAHWQADRKYINATAEALDASSQGYYKKDGVWMHLDKKGKEKEMSLKDLSKLLGGANDDQLEAYLSAQNSIMGKAKSQSVKEQYAGIAARVNRGSGNEELLEYTDPGKLLGLGKRDKGRNESAVADGLEIRGAVVASEIQARKTMIDDLNGYGFSASYANQWNQFKSGEHFEVRNGKVRLKEGEIEQDGDLAFMRDANNVVASEIDSGNIALKQALEDSIDNQREYAKKIQDIARRLGTTDIESVMKVLEGELTSSTDKVISSLIKMKKKIDAATDDKK